MQDNIEARIALLEQQLLDHHMLYMILLNLIFRHDDGLRMEVAEAIRRILQNPIPSHPVSAGGIT